MPGKKETEQARREQLLQAAFEVAARRGIGSLTVRAIAAEAGVSHGLVHFHFKTKGQVVRALLERVLENTLALDPTAGLPQTTRPVDRLRTLLEQEMERLSLDPRRTRLFFEYWAMGARDAAVGERVSAELERYRSTLRGIIEEALQSEPAALGDVTPDGLAAVVVSFINGCAVQAMIDPRHFDLDEYLAAVRGILRSLGAAGE
jgi:TetR/AcrR family transcriptional regulator, transcriptional repressor of bet genes